MANFSTRTYKANELTALTAKTQTILKNELLYQTTLCPLCNSPLDRPVLDHQHALKSEIPGENGACLIRGLLCNNCNAFLGKIENNSRRFNIKNLPDFLRATANYLEADNMPYIHSSETWRLKEPLGKAEYNAMIKGYCAKTGKSKDYALKKFKYSKYYNKNLKELQKFLSLSNI